MQQPNPMILLPLLRRVMPNLIAQDIMGASPMTGPAAQIFRSRYRIDLEGLLAPRRHPVSPEVYRHFLRINNRRRTQNDDDLRVAGYPWVTLEDRAAGSRAAADWCDLHLARHSWLRFPPGKTWWFSRHEDAALFRMVWS